MKRLTVFLSQTIVTSFLLVTATYSNVLPVVSEIRNEQPNSTDNNAIRIRLFNQGSDVYQRLSFCYQFHASKKFVFNNDWYLPGLDYKIDTLPDNTFRIHFRLKENIVFTPNSYFPNESGIVFGLRYDDWSPWNHDLDYSYSSSPTFIKTDRVFVSNGEYCSEDGGNSIGVLGHDSDKNGIRDDIDVLINERFPSSPIKRASYKYVAKSIQSQWIAFSQNTQISYSELLPYSVYVALGIDLIDDSGAENELPFSEFLRRYINTTSRIQFEDKLSDIFVGKMLPVYVKNNSKYSQLVVVGMTNYQSILQSEMGAK